MAFRQDGNDKPNPGPYTRQRYPKQCKTFLLVCYVSIRDIVEHNPKNSHAPISYNKKMLYTLDYNFSTQKANTSEAGIMSTSCIFLFFYYSSIFVNFCSPQVDYFLLLVAISILIQRTIQCSRGVLGTISTISSSRLSITYLILISLTTSASQSTLSSTSCYSLGMLMSWRSRTTMRCTSFP